MNYHIMIDDKFIESFIDTADNVASGKNVYVYTFLFPGKYVKRHQGISAPYGSEALQGVFNQLQKGDRLYVHWFDDRLLPYLNSVNLEIPVNLFLWGGDFLEQTPELVRNNYGTVTRKLVEHTSRNSMFRRTANPIQWMRMLKDYFSYHSRMKALYERLYNNRKTFLSRLQYMYHWNPDDIRIIENAYKVPVAFHDFFYDLGLQKISPDLNKPVSDVPLIWLGNSATPTNNHLEALQSLTTFIGEKYKIFAPLSYGLSWYAKEINRRAISLHGNSFNGLMEFMPLDEYLKLIEQADVVIMNHHRSQAGANIFAFIYMGKKVYLSKKSSVHDLMVRNDILVFDADTISHSRYEDFIKPLSYSERLNNSNKILQMFSEDKRLSLLSGILN
ncbi:MAG TPA: TDP-N-acetylfucosamine:lipid II N-acetylfucosaminyltransferase [Ferruginibacter sp.]|nr:TDP-N-acetylfucosamine:lipid II N-acetylfucosaminyltransferase [Ferruginibacter sp.]HRO95993.1 TDP-N-acetylfucosamine:lipid II N-acetylfucosaminyltransferase [Ferruginibacter sp.]HRP48673.1 TDP-N-acetylfucosamine:lipid II N-acetylfucosaminyltransferase [Ferruginibacter sp.]